MVGDNDNVAFFTDVSRETPTYYSFSDSLLQGVKYEHLLLGA
jgi:hypothetical protein